MLLVWLFVFGGVAAYAKYVYAPRVRDSAVDTAIEWQEPVDAQGATPPAVGPVVARRLRARVIETRPHDPSSFTQGLVLDDGRLFESAGLTGRSDIREVDPLTGVVKRKQATHPSIFAEGLALVGDELIQISWQNAKALVYRKDTFEKTKEFTYQGEGWGLCYDGRQLVMSDGTPTLTFRNPATFEQTGRVTVTLDGDPLRYINELECVRGHVFANIWQTDEIVEIDPRTGAVLSLIDASNLMTPAARAAANVDVLNGIAFDPASGHFLLTGKLWPQLFVVEFVSAAAP